MYLYGGIDAPDLDLPGSSPTRALAFCLLQHIAYRDSTVWFHANEGNQILGALDTGSNVFLTWAIQVAVAWDFMKPANRAKFIAATTLVNALFWVYIGWNVSQGNPRPVLIDIPPIFFTTEEVMLIINAFLVTGLFFYNNSRIPKIARKTLYLVFGMFIIGMMLASAKSSEVPYRILPLHSLWHIWSAFALTGLWVFNQLRFSEPVPILPRACETSEG